MQDSIWFRTIEDADRAVLAAADPVPDGADVVIVGAGLIGLATAFYLTRAGVRDVLVLDRAGPAAEASGANAGGLWFGQQIPELGPVAHLAKASSELYQELKEELSFDFRRTGMLELFYDAEGSARADEKVEKGSAAGFRVEKLSGKQARSLEPALEIEPEAAVYYAEEGQLHPVKLAAALVREVRARGGRIAGGVDVRALSEHVETERGPVRAGAVVIAAGAWTPLLTETLGWKPPIRPIRGVLLALRSMPVDTLRHTIMTENYYHWQLAAGPVAGGGSEEDIGFERDFEDSIVDGIRSEMDRHFPSLASEQTACAWSGFRPFCEDLKPVIGRAPGRERTFVAAGHFKKGVMMTPVTGKIMADLIVKGETDLDIAPLDPARFTAAPG